MKPTMVSNTFSQKSIPKPSTSQTATGGRKRERMAPRICLPVYLRIIVSDAVLAGISLYMNRTRRYSDIVSMYTSDLFSLP